MNDAEYNEFARAHGLPTMHYQIFTCNDDDVCAKCRAAGKIVTAKKPRTPVAGCTSEVGCRCFVVRTQRPVGPVKPFPVTSGAHRKGRAPRPATTWSQEDGCIEVSTPSLLERLLGRLRRKEEMNDLIVNANGEVEQALREIRGIRSASYARQAGAAVQRYQTWAAGRGPEAITIRLEAYGRHLLDAGLQPQSVRQAVTPLKLVVRQLAKATGDVGLYRDVQAALSLVELPKADRGGKLPFWLSTAQAKALLKGATGRDRLVLLLMLGCGLRRAEVAAIGPEDFEQRDGHTVLTISNKGRVRSLPVPAAVVRALEAEGWTVGLSGRGLYDVVRKHGKRVGLPELRPHDLRRTFARAFHESGGGLHDLAAVLGHSSVETTRKYIGVGFDLDAMVRPLPYLKGLQDDQDRAVRTNLR